LQTISICICQSNELSIWNIVGKVAGVDHPCSSSADNTRTQTFSGQAFLSPDLAEYIICSYFILDLSYPSSKLIKKIKKCEVMLNTVKLGKPSLRYDGHRVGRLVEAQSNAAGV
jgi:hypothetical protein